MEYKNICRWCTFRRHSGVGKCRQCDLVSSLDKLPFTRFTAKVYVIDGIPCVKGSPNDKTLVKLVKIIKWVRDIIQLQPGHIFQDSETCYEDNTGKIKLLFTVNHIIKNHYIISLKTFHV